MGAVLDRVGPRWTSILGGLLFGAGCVTFSLGLVRPCESLHRVWFKLIEQIWTHTSCEPSISTFHPKIADQQWFLPHGSRSTSNVSSSIPPYFTLSLSRSLLITVSNAFPTRSGLVLGAVTGAFDASSLPLVFFKLAYFSHHGRPSM